MPESLQRYPATADRSTVTRRLGVTVACGLLAVLAAGGFAVYAHRPARLPAPDPSWGLFSKAEWRSLGATRVVAAMPPLAVVSVRGCLVVLNRTARLAAVCHQTQPLRMFALRAHGMTDVVGIVRPDVASVVGGGYNLPLLRAPHAYAFGVGLRSASTFTAYDARGHVVARVYCASALRGSCGESAQRSS